MERAVAIKKLGKLLGKSVSYRVDLKGLTAEERSIAAAEAKALAAEYKAADEAETARRIAVLNADAEYQQLRAETKRLKKAKDEAWSRSHHYRFTVGNSNGMFFHVKAQGDSWEDVIEQLNSKARNGRAA
jgi:hypothetical protein